jgi:plastocyanin
MKSTPLRLLFLILATLPAAAFAQTTHVVNQLNLTFRPNDITIEAGDTVRWVYSSGSHTVTSGTGTSDPTAGSLFDAPLNGTNTTFEYTFDTPGDYDYFCRPHANFGMTGVIRVNAVSAAGDVPTAAVTLESPWPNPFNPRTEIRFTLAEAGMVDLEVFDARGRLVRTLLRGDSRGAGGHRVVWDGTDAAGAAAPSGTYLFRVRAGRNVEVVKGALVR